MKASRSKTEYMCVNEKEKGVRVKLQEADHPEQHSAQDR